MHLENASGPEETDVASVTSIIVELRAIGTEEDTVRIKV